MSLGESTRSIICVAIAERGMPSYLAVDGSCATVIPPIDLISRTPSAPSDAVPDNTTPIACSRSVRARDLKKKSIGVVLGAIFGTRPKMEM